MCRKLPLPPSHTMEPEKVPPPRPATILYQYRASYSASCCLRNCCILSETHKHSLCLCLFSLVNPRESAIVAEYRGNQRIRTGGSVLAKYKIALRGGLLRCRAHCLRLRVELFHTVLAERDVRNCVQMARFPGSPSSILVKYTS